MATGHNIGLVLTLLIPGTTGTICYHYDTQYFSVVYVGYCYEGCCQYECCESTTTTESPVSENTEAIIVGSVLGFALFVAIAIIIGVCCYYKSKISNQTHPGRILNTTLTYQAFQGQSPHAPPHHLPPLRQSHGIIQQSTYAGHPQWIQMAQLPHGQQSNIPGYLPDLQHHRPVPLSCDSPPIHYEPLPSAPANHHHPPPYDEQNTQTQ